jgi:hypothetical protein
MPVVERLRRAVTGTSDYRRSLELALQQAERDVRAEDLAEAEAELARAVEAENAHRDQLRGNPRSFRHDALVYEPNDQQAPDGSGQLVTRSSILYGARSNAAQRVERIIAARDAGAKEIVRIKALMEAGDNLTSARNDIGKARTEIERANAELAKLDGAIVDLEAQAKAALQRYHDALVTDASATVDAQLAGDTKPAVLSVDTEPLRISADRLAATVEVARQRRAPIEARLADACARRDQAAAAYRGAWMALANYQFGELIHGHADVIARYAVAQDASQYRGLQLNVDWNLAATAERELAETMRA